MPDQAIVPGPGRGPWQTVPEAIERFTPFPDAAVSDTIIGRLRHMAQAFSERTAISSPAGSWTYGRLIGDIDARASAIRARLGGDDGRPVAIVATHDGPLVVTILSVIAAGHLVVVLDPAAAEPSLAELMEACSAPLVIHDAANADLAGRLAAASTASIDTAVLDELHGPVGPLPERHSSDAVMLAFTSGTSGSPKAAIITNAVLLNLVRGATNALGISADDRMPMLFPTSLAVAAYPMFLPLLNGGTLATLDLRTVGLAPLAEFLVTERITLAYMAPTVVRFLVDALGGLDFPDLRLVALGGELVDPAVVRLTKDLLAPTWLANGYGTTETGVISLYVIDPDDPPDGAVPAGHAVPEVELHILDDAGRPLARGEVGEVAVASPHMFDGYWEHPELNRQVLSDDPAGRTGWRLYRTGDFGHIDDQGALVVSGRMDTKVKIRGRFVVLGDVEAAVAELDGVTDCAVVARVSGGQNELVAYVVAADESTTGTALRARLLEEHEAYRVPSRWVLLDEFPRLPNGKTDRRSLPSPEAVAGSERSGGDHGSGDHARVREQLQAIWQRLLPVGRIGLDEDFYHLGGDSLLAAQMLMTVEHELGVVVPMGELIHARTVRELAEVVSRIEEAPSEQIVSCIEPGDPERPILWFVPDLQGSAYRLRHLTAHLGSDQPLWSFESPLLAGRPNKFTMLDTFAAFLLRHLREVQPEGPYFLAGYSFGGVCAYEMARQLRSDGQDVEFLGVIDVGPGYRGPGWNAARSPGRPWFGIAPPAPADASAADRLRYYADLARTNPSGALRHTMVRAGLHRVVDPLRFRADLRRTGTVRPEWRLWYAWEEHWKLAAKAWERSRRYEGRMDLFWEATTGSTDSTLGWGGLVDDLVIHRFAVDPGGDHDAILEPSGAGALGRSLRAAVDAALARRGN